MLINIIIINISIIFFFNIIFFFLKPDFFVTTQTTKFMTFFKYNIDSQSFKNVCILNI